jgi:hypothetical protein
MTVAFRFISVSTAFETRRLNVDPTTTRKWASEIKATSLQLTIVIKFYMPVSSLNFFLDSVMNRYNYLNIPSNELVSNTELLRFFFDVDRYSFKSVAVQT